MNDIFDWTRFCKVVRNDIMNIWPRAGKLMMLIAAVPVAIWLLQTLTSTDGSMSAEFRWMVIEGVIILFGIFFPSTMYYSCNRPKQGIRFAMLPASHLEKYLSMLLNCLIVAPLILLIGIVLCDTLLTLIPYGPYHETLFSALRTFEIPIGDAFTADMPETEILAFVRKFRALIVISTLLYQMVFIFTNTVFSSHKFIFTVLLLWGLQFVSQLFMFPILISSSKLDYIKSLAETDLLGFLNKVIIAAIIISTLIIALLVWWTGYRLKKMRY